MAAGGENRWPPTGRNRWPLTDPARRDGWEKYGLRGAGVLLALLELLVVAEPSVAALARRRRLT
jgi:hypothetical protein